MNGLYSTKSWLSGRDKLSNKGDYKMGQINNTTNYDQFSLLDANRDLYEGHLDRLDKEFEEYGNITQTSPILVNEKSQVIDGQHRLEICKRRGLPVYFLTVPGLTVEDAIRMNVLHRGWGPVDYARSYAKSGNKNYQIYLELLEDYSAPHRLVESACGGGSRVAGSNVAFREGNMVVKDVDQAKGLLDIYTTIRELTGVREVAFHEALWNLSKSEGYEHKRMISKLAAYGEQLYKPFAKVEDNMRQLEEIYNYKQPAPTRVRLY